MKSKIALLKITSGIIHDFNKQESSQITIYFLLPLPYMIFKRTISKKHTNPNE